jgi:hypothetical protein
MRVLRLAGIVVGLGTVVNVPLAAQSVGAVRDTSSVRPQGSTSAAAEPACCVVVRVDLDRSMITARELATGFTFRFEPKSRRAIRALKPGQPVWADFTRKTVKLAARDTVPCCAIIAYTAP